MVNIRKLEIEQEFREFVDIAANAYPAFKFQTAEDKRAFIENSMKVQIENPSVNFMDYLKMGTYMAV